MKFNGFSVIPAGVANCWTIFALQTVNRGKDGRMRLLLVILLSAVAGVIAPGRGDAAHGRTAAPYFRAPAEAVAAECGAADLRAERRCGSDVHLPQHVRICCWRIACASSRWAPAWHRRLPPVRLRCARVPENIFFGIFIVPRRVAERYVLRLRRLVI